MNQAHGSSMTNDVPKDKKEDAAEKQDKQSSGASSESQNKDGGQDQKK